MTKDEILYLAVAAGVSPITLERRGITPDATDEEIRAARLKLAAIYTELEYKWNRATAAIHPDNEVSDLSPSAHHKRLTARGDKLDTRIARLMEIKAGIEREIVQMEVLTACGVPLYQHNPECPFCKGGNNE